MPRVKKAENSELTAKPENPADSLRKDGFHLGEKIYFEWKAPEYRNIKAIKKNLKTLLVLGVILLAGAIYNSNFLFAATLAIIGVIFWILSEEGRVKVHRFVITDSGIWIDDFLHGFIEFKYFSVLPYSTKADKFFLFTKNKGQRLRITLPGAEAEKIRLLVNRYVPQKEYQPGLSDIFERMLH